MPLKMLQLWRAINLIYKKLMIMILDEKEWRLMWVITISFTLVHLTVMSTEDRCSASGLKQYFYYPTHTGNVYRWPCSPSPITDIYICTKGKEYAFLGICSNYTAKWSSSVFLFFPFPIFFLFFSSQIYIKTHFCSCHFQHWFFSLYFGLKSVINIF